MNDPAGLVYHDREYHLFYQHNPDGVVWGNIHWGHAISTDLVCWTDLPPALEPDELGMIFTGSVVVDSADTAGFGSDAMVAIFTHHTENGQNQSLAYSLDRGRSWTKYPSNPVLEPPHEAVDFRDPRVFWHEGAGRWVMALAADREIRFYHSDDLTSWAQVSSFGGSCGSQQTTWETPDLFELPVDGGPETRWVLSVGQLTDGPSGGSGTRYFLGEFDGAVFSTAAPPSEVLWMDHGADFYASQTWEVQPDGGRVAVGWMSNWAYANDVPAVTFRGSLTVPRRLALARTPAGVRLLQWPISGLDSLVSELWMRENVTLVEGEHLGEGIESRALNIEIRLIVDERTTAGRLFVGLRRGGDEETLVGYSFADREIFVNRMRSDHEEFHPLYRAVHATHLAPIDGVVDICILLDSSSVEVFGQGGLVTITDQIFPSPESLGLDVTVEGGSVLIERLRVATMDTPEFRVQP